MKFLRILLLAYLLLVTTCMSPAENPDNSGRPIAAEPTKTQFAFETPAPTITPSKISQPSPTFTPTQTAIPPTITPTPQPLSLFHSSKLRTGVTPVTYLEDPCTYLENRWGEGKSEPGTIVVPIMFHSVAKPGREIVDPSTISMAYFEYFMDQAKVLGFSTITIEDLIGFLEENQKIPERSMLLILDDRRPGVTELFMPYLEENDWTLTLAWPTTDATQSALWERMEKLAASGHLDIQSHGHDHIYIQDYTPMKEIEEEINRPIEVIETHFGTTPRALIWPGGNFIEKSILMAADAGFKVGFTVFSRGPLMYNWIPQGEEELEMSQPLLVLPRYWSKDADIALDQALSIGEAARLEAEEHRAEELNYMEVYCQSAQGE